MFADTHNQADRVDLKLQKSYFCAKLNKVVTAQRMSGTEGKIICTSASTEFEVDLEDLSNLITVTIFKLDEHPAATCDPIAS